MDYSGLKGSWNRIFPPPPQAQNSIYTCLKLLLFLFLKLFCSSSKELSAAYMAPPSPLMEQFCCMKDVWLWQDC